MYYYACVAWSWYNSLEHNITFLYHFATHIISNLLDRLPEEPFEIEGAKLRRGVGPTAKDGEDHRKRIHAQA
jgi:hypothetical protein